MNKKGFSIIELISVLIIIACILLFLFPKASNKIETTKKGEYITEVKEIVEKAKLMYEDTKYLNDSNYFTKLGENKYYITLDKINNITDYVDSFGYLYEKEETKITFVKTETNELSIIVDFKSCDPNKANGVANCYEIVDEEYDKLDEKSVKNTIH